MENTLEKILEATVEESNNEEIWMTDETINNLFREADAVRVNGNLMKVKINGYELVVDTQPGKLIYGKTMQESYYRIESINSGLYKRNDNATGAIVL